MELKNKLRPKLNNKPTAMLNQEGKLVTSHKDLKNNGTALYEPLKNISSEEHFSLEETKKYFKKIKTCPFIPNSVLIFPRTSKSFHGVEEINIFQKERNLLLLNYNLQQNIK